MSLVPNPGSLVRLKSGQIGLVTKVTSDGKDDRILLLGFETRFRHDAAWEIVEILAEPEYEK